MSYIDQPAREVARVRRPKCGIGKTFSSAVRTDEVIGDRKPFTEVCSDRQVDDLTGRIGHQAAHSGKLAHLLFITASAGVCHHEDRIEGIHIRHHRVGDGVGCRVPQVDDFFITLQFGDETARILLLDLVDLFFGRLYDVLLLRRHDDVRNRHSHARNTGIMIAHILHVVNNFGGCRRAETIETGGDEFAELLFIHKYTEVPTAVCILTIITEFGRQELIENHSTDGRIDEHAALIFFRFRDCGIVRRRRQLICGNARLDGSLQCEFALLICESRFRYAGDDFAFALCPGL